MKRISANLAALAGVCAAVLLGAGPAAAVERDVRGVDVVEGRYIVVFEESVRGLAATTSRLAKRLGFETRHRYRHALPGFSAKLAPGQLKALRANPLVDFISPVRRVGPAAQVPLTTGEFVPTGVRRILAATPTTASQSSGVSVAVLDTGVQIGHPDLNVVDGTNCISPGASANDGNGHGTHVAGVIGAKNNGSGVVGVAPGTAITAVKVLPDFGDGTSETVACGIDWVAANHNALNIKVANLSLSGVGEPLQSCGSTTDPEHAAICNATAAGVNFVVAAGNSTYDFDFAETPEVPAAYPQVLTVTAMADTDGQPGGSGPDSPGCMMGLHADDTVGGFSNFASTPSGEAHTIAAPGVCIASTSLGGGAPTSLSGTSFASPHIAGLVALCLNEGGTPGACAGMTPAQVIDHIRGQAANYNAANPGYGFLRDPLHSPIADRRYAFLARAPLPPPPVCRDVAASTFSGQPVQLALDCTGKTPLSHQITSQPANGEASGLNAASGTLTYRPDPGFTGEDSLIYRATNEGGASDEAIVRISVSPPKNRFSFVRLEKNQKKGIAKLLVAVPGPGKAVLKKTRKTRGMVKRPNRAKRVSLKVKARGKAKRRISKRRCRRTGRNRLAVRVRPKVTYKPAGGKPRTKGRKLKLVRRC